jgi:hypothetical protein
MKRSKLRRRYGHSVGAPFHVAYGPVGTLPLSFSTFAAANRKAMEVIRIGQSTKASVLYVGGGVRQVLARYFRGPGGGVVSVSPEGT